MHYAVYRHQSDGDMQITVAGDKDETYHLLRVFADSAEKDGRLKPGEHYYVSSAI